MTARTPSAHPTLVAVTEALAGRGVAALYVAQSGCGREPFASFRQFVGSAESGASPLL
jgi:hypothetical protein